MLEIEKPFSETTKIILGSELGPIDRYSEWLGRGVPLPYPAKSSISGNEVWLPPPLNFAGKSFSTKQVVDMCEMAIPKSPFTPGDVANASLKDLRTKFSLPVAFYCGNFRNWTHENLDKVSGGGKGRNIYYGEDIYLDVKNIAFSNYVLYSVNVFGSHNVINSQFCIHAYNSTAVTRCFEVEGCNNSSDLLFSHNCENVQDSMFCFNAKNLRNAIGNVPLPPDRYKELKAMVLSQVVKELKEKKTSKYSIFNIGGSNE